MSYLSELLHIEQIQLELRGQDKSAVLKELVDLAPEIRKEPGHQELFLHALLEREPAAYHGDWGRYCPAPRSKCARGNLEKATADLWPSLRGSSLWRAGQQASAASVSAGRAKPDRSPGNAFAAQPDLARREVTERPSYA